MTIEGGSLCLTNLIRYIVKYREILLSCNNFFPYTNDLLISRSDCITDAISEIAATFECHLD